MPVMSMLEQSFCRSALWRGFTRKVALPWAMQQHEPTGSLLELGSGSGAMAEETVRLFPDLRVTVTDLDPRMVAAARQRLADFDQVTVQHADVTDLPFEDGSFDTVASYLMLHHVINWQAALREARRVLKPGGVLVGYDLTRTRLARLIHMVDRSPHHLITPVAFEEALRTGGFGEARVERSVRGHLMKFTARAPAT